MRARTLAVMVMAALLPAALLPARGALAQQAAEKRTALVIGNADYKDAPLRNPVNDARRMAARLRQLGFDVIARENATRRDMAGAVAEFSRKLGPGSAALVYYAGHGVQAHGRNYLIPIDAAIESETDLRFQAVDLGTLTDELEQSQSRVSFVILDACRNNPFERRLRGAARGLAPVDAARGTLIAYATAPGSVAADGDGDNGVYTAALLKALAAPGLKAEEVFKRVRVEVAEATRNRQTPWESSSLTGDFVFNLTVNVAPPAAAAPVDREALFWQSAQASNRVEEYEAYLAQYPQGAFAALARARVAALKAPPPPQSSAAPVPDRPEIAIDVIDREYVATETARVREAPDVRSRQVGLLKEGDRLLVLGKVKGRPWLQVERKDGAPAYVSAGLLEEAAAHAKRRAAGAVAVAGPATGGRAIPLTMQAWVRAAEFVGPVSAVAEGLLLRGGAWTNGRLRDGAYDGNRVTSREEVDLTGGGDVYMTFMPDGAGKYMGFFPRLFTGVGVRHMTTHHSWADSVVVPDRAWLYGHLRVEPDGGYRVTVARNAYDDRGGDVIYSNAGRLASLRGRVEMQFGDNYAGTQASLLIREVVVR